MDLLNYIMFTTSRDDAVAYLDALNVWLGYPKPGHWQGRRWIYGELSYSAVEERNDALAWRVNIPDDAGGIFDAGPPVTISSSGDGWIDPATYNGVAVQMDPLDPAWQVPPPSRPNHRPSDE